MKGKKNKSGSRRNCDCGGNRKGCDAAAHGDLPVYRRKLYCPEFPVMDTAVVINTNYTENIGELYRSGDFL